MPTYEEIRGTVPGPTPYPDEPRRHYSPDPDEVPGENEPDRPDEENPEEPDVHPQPIHSPIR